MSWWASPRLQVLLTKSPKQTHLSISLSRFSLWPTARVNLPQTDQTGYTDLVFDNPDLNALNLMSTHTACTWSQEPHALHLCLDKMERFVTPPQRNLLCSSTKTLEASEMHLSVNVSVNRSKWTFLPCRTTTSVRSFEIGGSITGKLANYFNVEPCSYTFLTSFDSCSQLL